MGCIHQVRADCQPSQLLDFLVGGAAAAASNAAEEAASIIAAEGQLLDEVHLLTITAHPHLQWPHHVEGSLSLYLMDISYLPELPLLAYCIHVCYITTDAHAQVKKALDAKHVVNVCSSLDSSKAMRALQQLLENAEAIKSMVSLSGEHPLHMYMKKESF